MHTLRNLLITIGLAAVAISPWHAAASTEPVHAPHAMVVSVHHLASDAGVEVMKQGGNAIDAAVATGFALAVVHPPAGNIGGGGFMLIRLADGKVRFIDYRETAPAAATADMYLDAKGNVIDNASLVGYKAIGVPGSVAGLVYAEKKFGKLTLKQVMAPAIHLAKEGYALTWGEAMDMQYEEHLGDFPESHRIFQRGGNFYKPDEIFKQPELARTLERISEKPDDFYRGAMAHELAAAIQKGGGIITEADLAKYEVKEREPIHGTYRGYDIYTAPPPSSGGTVLVESLNILEGFNLPQMGRNWHAFHFTVEAYRRAFYDRAEFMGDPDFNKVPVAQLTDKRYAAAWRDTIDPSHASVSKELKRPAIFSQLTEYAESHPQPEMVHESPHTTHYSVVDSDGNAVAVTTTINDWWGSRVTAEGLGFLLNDEMDDFAAKVGVPNSDGLIQGPANAVGPGKRPLSSMTPTIIVHNGQLAMVLGSPGSSKIITTVANVAMGVIDYGMNMQEAVNSPRIHNQWLPDETDVEQTFFPDTVDLLKKAGHRVEYGISEGPHRGVYWSDAECIAIDPKTGERLGATDWRNTTGKAVGY